MEEEAGIGGPQLYYEWRVDLKSRSTTSSHATPTEERQVLYTNQPKMKNPWPESQASKQGRRSEQLAN